jgi:hypothetical protein
LPASNLKHQPGSRITEPSDVVEPLTVNTDTESDQHDVMTKDSGDTVSELPQLESAA